MMDWLIANGATLIIGMLVLVVIAFAGRNVYKTRKSGGCAGCASSAGCPSAAGRAKGCG
ncbi:MAG: FeoB-associated Cys-rich membrane protein [Desulfitobacterium sp.]